MVPGAPPRGLKAVYGKEHREPMSTGLLMDRATGLKLFFARPRYPLVTGAACTAPAFLGITYNTAMWGRQEDIFHSPFLIKCEKSLFPRNGHSSPWASAPPPRSVGA